MFESEQRVVEDQLDEKVFSSLVNVRGDQVVTTSRTIAKVFGKVHRDVVRAIKNLEIDDEYRLRNFAQSSYIQPTPQGGSRKLTEYHITKDGCVILIMGFTGKNAMAFKIMYVKAFNWMQDMLLRRDELNWRINDYTARSSRSVNDGSYHGRGLVQRRIEKSNLAIEEMKIRSELQLCLSLGLGQQDVIE
ncbi:Rha family transcriptional regulator [Aeromonas veronii]|uniref:Rha family transcriptional regulator n=1 Tax=Aeromonas veronii TaxID=654 RepID=UPI0011A2A948|nr:Rha family transcriptional regulator [Aeromonas veronii]